MNNRNESSKPVQSFDTADQIAARKQAARLRAFKVQPNRTQERWTTEQGTFRAGIAV